MDSTHHNNITFDALALIPQAVEEILRYDSPSQRLARIAKEDIEFGEQRIRQGDRVFLVVGAANRDPEQFLEPDRFDVRRREIRHLSFGHGIHYCTGAALARIEGQLALAAMLQRFSRIRITEEQAGALHWSRNLTFRGLESLRIETLQ